MPRLRKKRKRPLKTKKQIKKRQKTLKERQRLKKKGFTPTFSFGKL